MIYITGDTHGSPARLSRESMPFAERWTKRDTLIVCGDFGYLFTGGPKEELTLRELSFRPYTILFIDGNRENFDLLGAYPPAPWKGGMVSISTVITHSAAHSTARACFSGVLGSLIIGRAHSNASSAYISR